MSSGCFWKIKGINNETTEIFGLVMPNSDLPNRYLAFGASELVKVSSDTIIPSSQPVKKTFLIRTKLADFERIEHDLASTLNDDLKEKFKDLFNRYRDVFPCRACHRYW